MESLNKYQQTPNLIEKWEKLQTLLKLEVTLMNLSKTHINTSIETINRNIIEYYRKKIQTKEAYDYNNQNLYLTKNQKSWSLPKYSLIDTGAPERCTECFLISPINFSLALRYFSFPVTVYRSAGSLDVTPTAAV